MIENRKKISGLYRFVSYAAGIILLAMGLTLTTETQLVASPLTVIPFVVANRIHLSFAQAAFLWFAVCVMGQLILNRVFIHEYIHRQQVGHITSGADIFKTIGDSDVTFSLVIKN